MSINLCLHLTTDQYMVQCVGVLDDSLGMNVHSAVLQVLYLEVDNIRSIPVTYVCPSPQPIYYTVSILADWLID